jgi:hypothetical protein
LLPKISLTLAPSFSTATIQQDNAKIISVGYFLIIPYIPIALLAFMNLRLIQAIAKKFREGDARLSYDVALTEAILNQVIVELNSKGKLPGVKAVDKSRR